MRKAASIIVLILTAAALYGGYRLQPSIVHLISGYDPTTVAYVIGTGIVVVAVSAIITLSLHFTQVKSGRAGLFSTFLGFVTLLIIALLLYYGLKCALQAFVNLENQVAAALVVAAATVSVSIIGVVVNKFYERKDTTRRQHNSKMVPIYERFMSFWFELMYAEKMEKEKPSEAKVLVEFSELQKQLILWGSGAMLQAFGDFRRLAETTVSEKDVSLAPLVQFDSLLLAIRRDLGHKNKGVKSGDLISLCLDPAGREHLQKIIRESSQK